MASREEAARLVRLGQATQEKRLIRLTLAGREHPCRTRVARGTPQLASIGMSQCYQTRDAFGKVNGFKTIYCEDRGYFNASTLIASGVVALET